ncbi:2,5-diketo-D-gluconic acid reductase [Lactiplantibacillus fabifermentans T30PCM01]|uniref:2,5-diketo-D-gluconic acid reductase n=1 Tax=Lactiplantibacillus fabifermentans T30PCM01 TaxID=1400520 RepID=W6T4C8_9LACO|nr:aldo/keto reductase [Lactiplantibacillus fabifermentans]ETY72533.1 2,5-diketo-D-gluconic acid reductase [Lactiplantibacillus fabifermentans T30PCM01]
MILDESYQLANGVKIPKLGYGTWMVSDADAPVKVKEAIELGYRHIDTAQGYANERGVGEAVKTSGVKRDDLFVNTKLDARFKDYQGAKAAIDESLQIAGLDYFDMMIIHSPEPWDDFRGGNHYFEGNLEAWRALEEAYQAGKLRAIGVSNFEQVDLDNLINHASVAPMVNQVLAHIGNTPFELIKAAQRQNIVVEAYSPVAHGAMMKSPAIVKMAQKYQVSVPQLAIKYCLQLKLVPLPKASSVAHMRNNSEMDFEINAADMAQLSQLKMADYGADSVFPVYSGKRD